MLAEFDGSLTQGALDVVSAPALRLVVIPSWRAARISVFCSWGHWFHRTIFHTGDRFVLALLRFPDGGDEPRVPRIRL